MATFVLVHGGGHGGWCYQPLARRLQAAGHVVYAPSLTGLGEREHLLDASVNLSTHITDVVSLLQAEDLSDVILAGHSYGGMVITGVADRAADRIATLLYLDAAHPRSGESLVDVSGGLMSLARDHGEVRNGIELVLLPAPGAGEFYGVTDPETLAWMDERLSPMPWACFEERLTLSNEDAVDALPRVNINCTTNLRNSPPAKVALQTTGDLNFEIDTGHDLMLTEPDALAAMLIDVANWTATRARFS